jgi:hypothetical protein
MVRVWYTLHAQPFTRYEGIALLKCFRREELYETAGVDSANMVGGWNRYKKGVEGVKTVKKDGWDAVENRQSAG